MYCLNQTINRIASVPFIGSLIGIPRATIAGIALFVIPIFGLLAAFFMGIAWIFKSSCWNWGFIKNIGKAYGHAWMHFGVGLAEIIPGVGGSVHLCLHNACKNDAEPHKSPWYWGEGGCCDTPEQNYYPHFNPH